MKKIFHQQVNNKPEKHLGYFKLMDSFHKKGCPVCSRNQEVAHNYLENLLYENVNDSDVRLKLRNSFGFCKEHVKTLIQIGDSLGTAIIYNDLLSLFESILVQNEIAVFSNRNTCLVCNLVAEETESDIKIFINYFDDSVFRKEFNFSDGLCAHHLILLLQKCKLKDQRDFYVLFHKKKIARLKKNLNELIRKNDYRFRSEGFTAEEGYSWIEAVRYLNDHE